MTSKINAYIGFEANAREAMEFYHSVFGGKLDMNTFAEFQASQDPSEADKIMHAQLDTDNGMTIMASDTPKGMEFLRGSNISLSLSGNDETELRTFWDKLADGGQVTMPISTAPWGNTFGMLTDKFGIRWMVNIAGTKS